MKLKMLRIVVACVCVCVCLHTFRLNPYGCMEMTIYTNFQFKRSVVYQNRMSIKMSIIILLSVIGVMWSTHFIFFPRLSLSPSLSLLLKWFFQKTKKHIRHTLFKLLKIWSWFLVELKWSTMLLNAAAAAVVGFAETATEYSWKLYA